MTDSRVASLAALLRACPYLGEVHPDAAADWLEARGVQYAPREGQAVSGDSRVGGAISKPEERVSPPPTPAPAPAPPREPPDFTGATETPQRIAVHIRHCCVKHGCKYGYDDCPVVAGSVVQDFPCENCDGVMPGSAQGIGEGPPDDVIARQLGRIIELAPCACVAGEICPAHRLAVKVADAIRGRGRAVEGGSPDVTRVELIDHRHGAPYKGRVFTAWDASVALSYQDNGQTLKVFVADRAYPEGTTPP